MSLARRAGGRRLRRRSAARAGEDRRAELAAAHAELDRYRGAVAVLQETCARWALGDLEARVPPLDAPDELVELRRRLNGSIDATDAFVREAGAALTAAAEHRYWRQFLEHGMPGAFRAGAAGINRACRSMFDTERRLQAEQAQRAEVAEAVLHIAERVADASSELSASAADLSRLAGRAGLEATSVLGIVESLDHASSQIHSAVQLIGTVADRTTLLALNANIEAARAGELGRGFGVVAQEVKALSTETTRASAEIVAQVASAQDAAGNTAAAIRRVTSAIGEMELAVAVVADAAGGTGQAGLAAMADRLRQQLAGLVSAEQG